ncbi:hypothetical protein M422DRAFT_783576 [Sphaerobolus stellatus SS14]|uniref:Uncharacterized protein n=1 Tax=Sphaerobolus stellatus (strain SS14) TaxID=990650 RepID=A0A0C9TPX9_SPHS4|nr:hypothetical protein M422DRAFT_783576 [Sphaerobolus stellatus SS14]
MAFQDFICVFLALNIISLLMLSAMLLTFSCSKAVKRHPVFINLILVCALSAAWLLFYDSAVLLLPPDVWNEQGVNTIINWQRDTILLMFITGFMSLVIHLAFTLRQIFHPISDRADLTRTILLIAAPYLSCLLPFAAVRPDPLFETFPFFIISFGVATTFLDVVLIFYYFRYRSFLQEMSPATGLTMSFGIRLLVLCLLRFFSAALPLAEEVIFVNLPSGDDSEDALFNRMSDAEILVEHAFPLFAAVFFCQKDILHFWFPCLVKNNQNKSQSSQEPIVPVETRNIVEIV